MFIHNNIKYLRKLKKLSQENFARRLGLNRGNIASYEQVTVPPLEVILKIADWYHISTDALLKMDLSESLSLEGPSTARGKVRASHITERLEDLRNFTELEEKAFAAIMGMSIVQYKTLLSKKTPLTVQELIKLINYFDWISLEWLIRGQGAMVGSTALRLSKVAEPIAEVYQAKDPSVSLELFMEEVLLRLDKLEGKKR